MEIKVLAMRMLSGDKPLKAFCDVKVGDWTVYEWRVVKSEGQRAWVSVPQASWKDRDGKVQYRALLSIPGELKQRIDLQILSAWEKEILKKEKST